MKAAILHYHLHPGGVTSVIASAIEALRPHNVRLAVITGAPSELPDIFAGLTRIIPGLDYNTPLKNPPSPTTLANRLEHEASKALRGAPDVWHIHNHSLGKNPVLTEAVGIMAQRGHKLLLQIHDFPEDLRPVKIHLLRKCAQAHGSSLSAYLYPLAPHVHYAALNRRDLDLLIRAGAPHTQAHSLPNAVAAARTNNGAELPTHPETPPLLLYPVRGIRRKNLGEFLLWSALANAGERYAITLAPRNPERPAYEKWMNFAQEHRLQVQFEWGPRSGLSLAALQRAATAILSTSIAEGFGLAFLESWLAGRPVVGRNLREITADFTHAGVDLSGLYNNLLVPIDCVGANQLRKKIVEAYTQLLSACGRLCKPDLSERAWQAACQNDCVDFGKLDEELRAKFIRIALNSSSVSSSITPDALMFAKTSIDQIEHNRKTIEASFSLKAYGKRLFSLYQRVASSETNASLENLNAERILDAFLAPERFTLLRSPGSNI